MRSLTCIICPVGCDLEVEEDKFPGNNLSISGNRCPRGITYAQEEISSPKRVVTATALIEGESCSIRRAPLKSSSPCPKEKISAMLDEIYSLKISLPVKAGDVIIANWDGSGIDIVATRSIGDTAENYRGSANV
ncbi:MAG: DUF1667 domain-containing protein [Treponema sp.]|nr:DUF1667 domain-containing protein [Treponema sp.]